MSPARATLEASASPPIEAVLGIDPGLDVTGYAVVAARGARSEVIEAGVIRTSSREPLARRVLEIHGQVSEILAEHPVDLVAVERLFSHYAHPRTAILMGHARGTVLLASASRGIPTVDLSPTLVKRSLTGSGRAGKEQMQRAVARVMGFAEPPEPHDVCDAIAIALVALARAHSSRAKR